MTTTTARTAGERVRRLATAVLTAAALGVSAAAAYAQADTRAYGGFGPEGQRLREQFWVVPGADTEIPLRATLFRPAETAPLPGGRAPVSTGGSARRPLVIINHGTDESTRQAVSMPVFYWLSRWFVERGYAVVLPQRRGHGATGGPLAEGGDFCRDPQHARAGKSAAADIASVLAFMREQPFVDADDITVVGISTGGWASLALAARNPAGLRRVVNFAGGRGGHAFGQRGKVCDGARLVAAAGHFGSTARVPTLWLYSSNDSFFGPDLATEMAGAFQAAGGRASLQILPAYGSDGHGLADDKAGWQLWGSTLERFLADDGEALVSSAPAGRSRAGL
jgi:dienelactone hydrolase